ncbi:hypothetical protein PMAYCL1PPCAC_03035, partial [Pristionchus mayeri]
NSTGVYHHQPTFDQQCIEVGKFLYENRSDFTYLPVTRITFGILYTFIITCGVAGNIFVVAAVLSNKSLQSVRNLFIVSLSASDIIVCIVSGTITPITAFSKIWQFGPTLCHFLPLIQVFGTSLCFSTFTLMAIAVDRFVLIIFPTRRPIQQIHALPMILFNIVVAVLISLPMFVRYRLESLSNLGNFCGQICNEHWDLEGDGQGGVFDDRKAYGTLVSVVQFGIPLVVIGFCYCMISLKISKGVLLRNEAPLITEQRRNALKRRVRTNRMLIAMVAVFICCWMPNQIFNFLRDYDSLPSFIAAQDYLWGIITHCISIMSTVWNPVLYALLNEQFRVAFKSLLNTLRGRPSQARMSKKATHLIAPSMVLLEHTEFETLRDYSSH